MSKLSTDVKVVERKAVKVVYVRNTGAYAGDESLFHGMFEKLCKWAGPRELLSNPDTQWLTIYHDNPEITDENLQRISVCMTITDDIEGDGEIGTMTVAGGKYAVGQFELSSDEFGDAWMYLCGEWLPESGYQAADIPAFELYLNDPEQHPEKKHIVEIYIPIKPL